MNYSQDHQLNLIDEEVKKINRDIGICREVRATLESRGWKDTIGPIIDRMIIDVVGGKIGDTWVAGKLNKARSDEKREYYVGYKQALIDLHNRIMFHLIELSRGEETIKTIEIDKKKGMRVPLIDDTKYNVREDAI